MSNMNSRPDLDSFTYNTIIHTIMDDCLPDHDAL